MALINSFDITNTVNGGEEHAVASFYAWFNTLFGASYSVTFDGQKTEFTGVTVVTFPNFRIQQIDTIDGSEMYMGGKHRFDDLLFYIYASHHLAHDGSRRLLRRMRDQVSYALANAGVMNKSGEFIISPIYFLDFSTTPPTNLNKVIQLKKGIQQRFIEEGELLQYEFMVGLTYHFD